VILKIIDILFYNPSLNHWGFFCYFLYRSTIERYKCSKYEHMKNNKTDHFEVLRKIQQKPKSTQRELAEELGFSLGKINYCLKALKDKGLVKIENFTKNPNKINYIYVLTPKGITKKTKLTINFMKTKIREYDELKSELNEKK